MAVKSHAGQDTDIHNVTKTADGRVMWEGVNGLQQLLLNANDTYFANGVMDVPDAGTLASMDGTVIGKVTVKDLGVFAYTTGTTTDPNDIQTTLGGYWKYIAAPPYAPPADPFASYNVVATTADLATTSGSTKTKTFVVDTNTTYQYSLTPASVNYPALVTGYWNNPKVYIQTIANSTNTTYTITHNLNTTHPHIMLKANGVPIPFAQNEVDMVGLEVAITSANVITLSTLSVNPGVNYEVTIVKLF